MARGKNAEIGAERTSQNGYCYVKTETGWRLKHHVVAEAKLGRPIRSDERVKFVNGKKTDFSPSNIEVMEKGTGSIRRRKAQIEARIAELKAELRLIEEELANPIWDHSK